MQRFVLALSCYKPINYRLEELISQKQYFERKYSEALAFWEKILEFFFSIDVFSRKIFWRCIVLQGALFFEGIFLNERFVGSIFLGGNFPGPSFLCGIRP